MSYILGVGAVGGLLAHELALAPHPPTLLFKSAARLTAFHKANSSLTLNRIDSQNNTTASSTHAAATAESLTKAGLAAGRIDTLVVTTKAFQTTAALARYVPHLDPKSNIIFIHNGMGVLQECLDRYWPILAQRPNFFKAVVSHGVYKTSPTVINHVGLGDIKLAYIPKHHETLSLPQAPEMVQNLVKIPALNGTYMDYQAFTMAEIDKLAVNACINPLTAILDCLNGDLLYGTKVVGIMRRILDELIRVVRAEHATTLQLVPEANTMLDQKRMLDIVLLVVKNTAKNSSSMREDVRNLNHTEVDYINGYVRRLGRKHGIATPMNGAMVDMVKTKVGVERGLDEAAAELSLASARDNS